jgi:hypothetical protein
MILQPHQAGRPGLLPRSAAGSGHRRWSEAGTFRLRATSNRRGTTNTATARGRRWPIRCIGDVEFFFRVVSPAGPGGPVGNIADRDPAVSAAAPIYRRFNRHPDRRPVPASSTTTLSVTGSHPFANRECSPLRRPPFVTISQVLRDVAFSTFSSFTLDEPQPPHLLVLVERVAGSPPPRSRWTSRRLPTGNIPVSVHLMRTRADRSPASRVRRAAAPQQDTVHIGDLAYRLGLEGRETGEIPSSVGSDRAPEGVRGSLGRSVG